MERYTVIRRLATTRTGQVLLCADKQTNAQVVVKRVKMAWRSSMSIERQVHRHLMQGQPANAHVVNLLDDFVQHGFEHLVLEYCANGELFDAVNKEPLETQVVQSYFGQICRVVQYMHSCGIAHCDLSLENVLMDANGGLKVSDFGLSMTVDKRRRHAVGKTFYMAPEMHTGNAYDAAAADVWSLGIMLFIMLTGSPPVETSESSDSVMQFILHHGWRALVRAWNFDDAVTDDAMDLLEKMLVVDPDQRMALAYVLSHPFVDSLPVTEPIAVAHKLHALELDVPTIEL
ncbi:hypothetical protein AC1031_018260 [Aphanomyces cochlioides]|nr:hypothetical protein AC1031_018260 [Aphanomyces cochlioides]